MKKIKTVLFSFLLLVLFPQTIFAIGQEGIGILPAYPREDNKRTESIFIFELAPGTNAQDGVVVMNNTNETKTILVYATDTTPSSDGAFACKQFSEKVEKEGTWYKLEQSEVTLEGGKNIIVPFTVTIPENSSVGEHNACIVVQEKKETGNNAGVNLSFRAAIRSVVTIPGDVLKKLEIKDFLHIKNESGKNQLTLTLKNEGNVSLDTSIIIEIITSKLFYSNTSNFTILNNNEQTFNFDIGDNPWGGIYKAFVTVSFEGQNGPEKITKERIFVMVPSVYAIALYATILIIVIATLLLICGSKKKLKIALKDSEEYVVKNGDTLNSIAKDHNLKWKLLAKINGKKPPYDVREGDRLLIPIIKGKDKEI
jgi:LysM repeat protein